MIGYCLPTVEHQVAAKPELRLGEGDWRPAAVSTSATGRILSKLRIGHTEYEFLRSVKIELSWDRDAWVCWVTGMRLQCKGRGPTPSQAQEDWERLFHATFQALYAKRPFEMDEREQAEWLSLVSIIDTHRYRETKPLCYRQVGQVRYGRVNYPSAIRWINGREENLDLACAPAELAACKPGQYIEADVRRDPNRGHLIAIDQVRPISSPPPLRTQEQRQEVWNSFPKAELPTEEWEWPSR